jgi:adenine-specific DNA-methyltransferase
MNTSKLSGDSADISREQKNKLKELLPEVFTEGKIDWQKLKTTLGEEIELGERYGLSWKGKSDIFRIIQEPTTKTLKPLRDESVNFDKTENVFIEGDNLEALKVLQKSYYGKIKMIYIDPPYNTGNDFVYNDKFAQRRSDYEQEAGLRDEAGNTTRIDGLRKNGRDSGHYHSNWLNMMYPRLYLARNLLRQDGVVFVSIDDNEIHNLRHMMDEIFGEENFIAQIVAVLNPRGRNLDAYVARTHEYVLIYGRSIETGESLSKLTKTGDMLGEYDKHDDRGDYRLIELRNRNPAFNKTTRPKLYYPIYIDPDKKEVALTMDERHNVEVLPHDSKGESTCWTWGRDKFSEDIVLLTPVLTKGGWRVYRKDYLQDIEGNIATTLPKTVWLEKEINHDYGKKAIKELFDSNVMSFPKSVSLIEKMLRLGTGKDSIVLDFFAGSGTLAQAVMRLNAEDKGSRKWICVQLPEDIEDEASEARKAGYENIAALSKERIRRAAKMMSAERQAKVDLGFRSLRLDESNFKVWDSSTKDSSKLRQQMLDHLNPVKDGASEEDLLMELSLKSGVDLVSPCRSIETTDGKYYLLDGGSLAICLEVQLSPLLFESVLSSKPSRIILLDSSLHNDDQLKTNLLLQAEKTNTEILVI